MESLDARRLGHSKRTGSRAEIRFCCPTCGDKNYKLYANFSKRVYHCFHCGSRGRLREVRDFAPVEQPKLNSEPPMPSRQSYKGCLYLDGATNGQKRGFDYWIGRGFTKNDASHYGIMFNPGRDTLFIPVHTDTGEFGFYQERRISAVGGMKYIFPKGVQISKYLFNSHRAKDYDRVCLVEGVMDSIAIGDRSMCLFGKQLHDAHIKILRQSGYKEILVWLDPDAMKESYRLVDRLLPFFDVSSVICDDSGVKDANDYLIKHGSDRLLAMLGLPDKGY